MWKSFEHKNYGCPRGAARLTEIPRGGYVTFMGVNAGCKLKAHLYSLGLIPGTKIEVVNNFGKGPLVLKINDSRIMLGRGVAEKILVI